MQHIRYSEQLGDPGYVMKYPYVQNSYPIFMLAPMLKSAILNDVSYREKIVKCMESGDDQSNVPDDCLDFNVSDYKPFDYSQIRKYLFVQLAKQHHPTVKEFDSGFSIEEQRAFFERSKLKKGRRWLVLLMGWCVGGILAFAAAARRIRNRRQQAWFDDASRGSVKCVMPGSPPILMVLIAFLCVVLISAVCCFMVKLS